MNRIDGMVVGKVGEQTDPLVNVGQEQGDKLVSVFQSLIGKEETFFQEYQSSYVKEMLTKANEQNVQLSLAEIVEELANTDDRHLLGFKVISKDILSDYRGINKLSYLIS